MTIYTRCQCGALLQGPPEFAGKRALCPACGAQTLFPDLPPVRQAAAATADVIYPTDPPPTTGPAEPKPGPAASPAPAVQPGKDDDIIDVIEFLDPPEPPPISPRAVPPRASEPYRPASAGGSPPPTTPVAKETIPPEPDEPWAVRILEAMLDPRSIQWMLMLGGGLMVIGLIIFLISQHIFDNPWVLAAALGIGSLAFLAAGWYFKLRTDYQTAGRAISFLACVVLPLNLWFYELNKLSPLVLSEQLWIGGLVCTLLYIATVWVLRDAIFVYAVELGITMTAVLMVLGPLQGRLLALDPTIDLATQLSLVLLVLALISIHLERAFLAEGEFSRGEYGLPLFWCGHAQLAAALCTLLVSQLFGYAAYDQRHWFGWQWVGNPLSANMYLAAGIWGVGAYAYTYSDLVVRRTGIYSYLAALCVLLCVGTLLAPQNAEVIAIVLALASVVTAMAFHTLSRKGEDERLLAALPPLTLLLAGLPLVIGVALHIRATQPIAAGWWPVGPSPAEPWLFAVAMAITMAANRVAAYLFEDKEENYSTAFYVFSGGAALIGAAALLRLSGVPQLQEWQYQAPILMLIPMAYLIAARLYRGRKPEESLGLVAHACTAAIVISGLFAQFNLLKAIADPNALGETTTTLLLALLFAETAVFYSLAAVFRRRSANIYFAAAGACLSLWQLLGFVNIEPPYYTLVFAGLGTLLHVAAFFLGLEPKEVYDREGKKETQILGAGLVAFQCANGILLVACLAAAWQGLVQLAAPVVLPQVIAATLATGACALVALFLVPSGGWRQTYVVAASVLAVIGGLHLYRYLNLDPARKVEIICVIVGVILLVASLIGRYRRSPERPDDLPTFGMSLGALLIIVPLFIAMVVKRVHPPIVDGKAMISIVDEFALVTAAVLMLLSGLVLRVRSTTILGALALIVHLLIVIGTVLYQPQVWIGVYLAAGGLLVFGAGVALSIYRDRLLALPQQIQNREGVFQVLDWT